MDATILFDFGMVGSGAIWWNDKSPANRHTIDKLPTMLLYDDCGDVVSWGTGYKLSPHAKSRFKVFFSTKNLPAPNPNNAILSFPFPSQELEKWIADFIGQFCRHILDEISKEQRIDPNQLKGAWHFTTPGSWETDIREDFQSLLSEVVSNIFPKSNVFVKLTEAFTSCHFMAAHFGFEAGKWVITCDIGGATTATALAYIESNDDGQLVPKASEIVADTSGDGGVASVDENFRHHIRKCLQMAGDVNFDNHSLTLMHSQEWQSFRHSFNGSDSLCLDVGQHIGDWKSTNSPTFIYGSKVTISESTVKGFFEPILRCLWFSIDKAAQTLKSIASQTKKPDVIGLSGGGGTMSYPLKQLQLRYSDIQIRAPASAKARSLATLDGHALYFARTMLNKYVEEISIGISNPSKGDGFCWPKKHGRIVRLEFETRKATVEHFCIVVENSSGVTRPASMSDLKTTQGKVKGTTAYILRVNLGRRRLMSQKYWIEATCINPGEFSFQACVDGETESILGLVANVANLGM